MKMKHVTGTSIAPELGRCPRTLVHFLETSVQLLQASESLDGDAHRGGFPTGIAPCTSIRTLEVWISCHLVAEPLAFHLLRLCVPLEVR